jgi:hypothetical protein
MLPASPNVPAEHVRVLARKLVNFAARFLLVLPEFVDFFIRIFQGKKLPPGKQENVTEFPRFLTETEVVASRYIPVILRLFYIKLPVTKVHYELKTIRELLPAQHFGL